MAYNTGEHSEHTQAKECAKQSKSLQRRFDLIADNLLRGDTRKCTRHIRAFHKRKARYVNVHFRVARQES